MKWQWHEITENGLLKKRHKQRQREQHETVNNSSGITLDVSGRLLILLTRINMLEVALHLLILISQQQQRVEKVRKHPLMDFWDFFLV